MTVASSEVIKQSTIPSYEQYTGMARDISVEHSYLPLRIEGKLPEEINGVYYQNGPGLFSAQGTAYNHIFDGDGLIRSVKIQGGKAHGAAKLVQTQELLQERSKGKMLYDGFGTPMKGLSGFAKRTSLILRNKIPAKNAANTNVIFWQGRLLALNEGGLPTELDPETLETFSTTNLDGVVKGPFSAHPHWVSERSAGYNFGLRLSTNNLFLDIYEMPAKQNCKLLTSIKMDWRCIGFIHDFFATPNYLVFFVPPMVTTDRAGFNALLGKKSFFDSSEWQANLGSQVLVVPIDRPEEVIKIPVDPFFMVHSANAYEENGKIVLDYLYNYDNTVYTSVGTLGKGYTSEEHAALFPQLLEEDRNYGALHRAEIDLKKRSFSSRQLFEDVSEFPRLNSQYQGRKNQYLYQTKYDERFYGEDMRRHLPRWFTNIIKRDLFNETTEEFNLGSEQYPFEPVFIRKKNRTEEDAGYLISMVYCGLTEHSYLAVFDAEKLSEGPVAKLHFDQALPIAFHGNWVNG